MVGPKIMLYEFLTSIDWIGWFERLLCATVLLIVIAIFLWTIPLFINWLLSISGVHSKIRQGCVLIFRLVIAVSGAFIIGDVLGYNSQVVYAIFGTVFGVGISWAIKDNVSNALSGLLLFVFQSYGIGDEIESPNLRFKGVIRSFHLQFVVLEDINTSVGGGPKISYVPNSFLWTNVINIVHNKADLCSPDLDQQEHTHNDGTSLYLRDWATQINV